MFTLIRLLCFVTVKQQRIQLHDQYNQNYSYVCEAERRVEKYIIDYIPTFDRMIFLFLSSEAELLNMRVLEIEEKKVSKLDENNMFQIPNL